MRRQALHPVRSWVHRVDRTVEVRTEEIAQHLGADASGAARRPDHCHRSGLEEVAQRRGRRGPLALLVAGQRLLGQRRGDLHPQVIGAAYDLHGEPALTEDLEHAAVLRQHLRDECLDSALPRGRRQPGHQDGRQASPAQDVGDLEGDLGRVVAHQLEAGVPDDPLGLPGGGDEPHPSALWRRGGPPRGGAEVGGGGEEPQPAGVRGQALEEAPQAILVPGHDSRTWTVEPSRKRTSEPGRTARTCRPAPGRRAAAMRSGGRRRRGRGVSAGRRHSARNHDHGTGRLAHDLDRRAADHHPPDRPVVARAHHQQIDALAGLVDDLGRGLAVDQHRIRSQLIGKRLRRMLEHAAELLAPVVLDLGVGVVMGIAGIGGEDLERRDHRHDLERRTNPTRQCRPLVQGSRRLVRAVKGDPDHFGLLGARREASRRDRDRAGGAVQQALAGAARQHAPDVTAMGGAHDDQVRLGLLGEDVQPMRRRVARDRLKRQPVGIDLPARLRKGLAGGVRHDRFELLAPARSRRGIHTARDHDTVFGPQLGGQRQSVLRLLASVVSDDDPAIHPGSFHRGRTIFLSGTMPGHREATAQPLSGFPHAGSESERRRVLAAPMEPGHTGTQLAERELQQLLEVGRSLVADLDVESVLQHVLETARKLMGARYAALGILDERKEELERFIFLGIDDETRRMIGPLPRGHGVLGELIRHPEPLRLHDVTQHPRSYGFPPGHPPMTSFLGVPILIRGEPFGNLYVTEKLEGDFDAGDEQAAVVLAEWAAIAIDNARLYQDIERRRGELERVVRGLEATATIARAVGFETDLERVLELIAKRGRALIEARTLLVLLEQADGRLQVATCAGECAEGVKDALLAADATIAGSVLAAGASERVPSLSDRVGHGLDPVARGATSAIVVPLGFRGRARGVLIALDRAQASPVFDREDEHLLTSFGASAAIAIATAQAVEAERLRHSMRASEAERRRWARELHDETLQELGGLKVLLESARLANRPGALEGAVDKAVEQLQLSIGGLQALITELRPAALDQLGVKPALEALLARTTATSGLEISARIDLASDGGRETTRLSGEIESTIYRLVQEALTNIVKHAEAEHAWAEISEDERQVTVTVRDDGRGFDPDQPGGGFGLVGMRERAELVNGRLAIDSSPEHGTTVRLVLPAERAHAAPASDALPERAAREAG
jgi:two-component system, NarL family, sensor histidine kinase DevS